MALRHVPGKKASSNSMAEMMKGAKAPDKTKKKHPHNKPKK